MAIENSAKVVNLPSAKLTGIYDLIERPSDAMIFIVEDDEDYRAELTHLLDSSGLASRCIDTLADLHTILRNPESLEHGDIVLLDLTIGSQSAFEFIQKISATPAACIVLTGSSGDVEKIIGLELGADDYVLKSCSPREILARVKAVSRRLAKTSNRQSTSAVRTDHGWRLDKVRLAVFDPAGLDIGLTVTEFKLLAILVDAGGEPVSREKLVRAILRREYDPSDRSIDNLISRVRNKFRSSGSKDEIIRSARHMGYIFLGFPEFRGQSNQSGLARLSAGRET